VLLVNKRKPTPTQELDLRSSTLNRTNNGATNQLSTTLALATLWLAGAGRGWAADPATDGVLPHSIPGDKPSAVFQARVNGQKVVVAEFHGLHYAHASCSGRAEGNLLRFAVPAQEPRYRLVQVNALPPLAVLLDPPETTPVLPSGKNVVNAADFVADVAGKADVTEGLAKAVAAVNNTGKTLYIGAGRYRSEGLCLKGVKNCGIYLASGVILQSIPGTPGAQKWSRGLHIEDCENITVSGRGGAGSCRLQDLRGKQGGLPQGGMRQSDFHLSV
jgi:hypothetical protein